MAGVQKMSTIKKLIGIIRNNLFARRDNDYPENEEPDTVSTLEDIVRQVKQEAAASQQMHEVNEFFSPTHVLTKKSPDGIRVPLNKGAAGQKKEKIIRRVRLTADQYEELIEKDLTVLEIMGQVIDRNVAIRSRLKISPA